MRRRMPTRPSQRAIRNAMAFASGGTQMEIAPARRNGRQKESLVNDAVKDWAKLRGGVLYRNRRGMVDLASGAKMPIGLGPNGYGDLVGYLPVTITPEMLGRTIAVYCMVESKVRGVPEPHQQARIDEVRAAGGIAGGACNAEDAEIVLSSWRARRG